MTSRVDPLTWNIPIVDPQGRPTPEFMRKWGQQKSINSGIDPANFDPAGAAAAARSAAESYADTGDAATLVTAEAFATAGDVTTLASAESYTNTKVALDLPLTGGTMSGAIKAADGAAATPSVYWGTSSGFWLDGANKIGISVAGVQIGDFTTTGPNYSISGGGTAQILVVGEGTVNNIVERVSSDASAANYTFRKARGTIASPSVPVTTDNLGIINATAYSGSTFTNAGQIQFNLIETSTVDTTHLGTRLRFLTCPIGSGTVTELARLDNEKGFSMFGANPVINPNRDWVGNAIAGSYQRVIPLTGFSQTISDNVSGLLLKPAGTIATGTVTMPATPVDGQEVFVASTQIITALTVAANTGQTINGAITSIAANQGFKWKYCLADTAWNPLFGSSGASVSGANPSATASDVAVNGSSANFMRADAAPAVQKCSSSVFGLAKADGTTVTSSGGVLSASLGGLSVLAFHPGYTSGRYYSSPFNVSNATLSTATGKAYFTNFYVPKTTTFTKASYRSGATGANGSMALYADSGGQPTGAPLQQFGEIASVANAHAEITGLTITLAPGWYWLGVGVSATVTLNSTTTSNIPLFLLGQSSGSSVENGYSMTWVYSAGTLPTVGALTAQTGATPLVYLRL